MRICLLFLFVILFPLCSKADGSLLLKKVESYLNGINTLVADFEQINPDGSDSYGKFFLSRPGKLRWQYDEPDKMLVVINGSLVTHYDEALDQASYASSGSSAAAILTSPNIDVKKDCVFKSVVLENGYIRLHVVNKENEEEEITLIFNESPLILRKLEIVDSTKQLTTVVLHNVQHGVGLDKSLFVVDKHAFSLDKR